MTWNANMLRPQNSNNKVNGTTTTCVYRILYCAIFCSDEYYHRMLDAYASGKFPKYLAPLLQFQKETKKEKNRLRATRDFVNCVTCTYIRTRLFQWNRFCFVLLPSFFFFFKLSIVKNTSTFFRKTYQWITIDLST